MQTKSVPTNSINIKQKYGLTFSLWETLIATFCSPATGKRSPSNGYLLYLHSLSKSRHFPRYNKRGYGHRPPGGGRFLWTIRTLAVCDHLDSIRITMILRPLAYCCLNAILEQHYGSTETTTKVDHKSKATERCTGRLHTLLNTLSIHYNNYFLWRPKRNHSSDWP